MSPSTSSAGAFVVDNEHVIASTLAAMTSILTSWKDIGKYLGKGTRTVQRWERQLGLPVRRTKQARKSAVLAFPEEIDAWVRSQKFPDGQLSPVETERVALLRSLEALRGENHQLRRQLTLAQKRISEFEQPDGDYQTSSKFVRLEH
jgi:hypothetical protein